MARQIGFHFYSVQVNQKYAREKEVLSSMRGREDLLLLMHTGMEQAINSHRQDEAGHRMACIRRVDLNGRHLTGLLEAGHYGETANIVNASTGRTAHRQRVSEAAMMPCFFRFVVPVHSERALLILQRDNRIPAKSSLQTMIQGLLHSFDDSLVCGLTPVANRATFERLIQEGDVQEVRFIRLSIPPDFAAAYDRGRTETKGRVEISYIANRGASLPLRDRIRTWLRGSASDSDQYEIPGLAFEVDTVKAKVRIGKKMQTVDFGRRLTQPIIDVTDQITVDPTSGHPTYESLLEASLGLSENDAFTAYGE